MKNSDLYWLAGLLEGEGCFRFSDSNSPVVTVHMTDRDVVGRASLLLGGTLRGPYTREGNRKPQWKVTICGDRAMTMMRTLCPLMGSRRAAKITEILKLAENRKGRPKGEFNHKAKLRSEWILLIRELCKRGVYQTELAKLCGVSNVTIFDVANGRTWKHIKDLDAKL